MPIGFKAFGDFADLVAVFGDDGVIAGFGEVLGLPIERHDERSLVIHHHGFLMREIEGRIAVNDLDAGVGQHLARFFVLGFPAAASRIEHDTDLHAAAVGRDGRVQQGGDRRR